MIASAVAAPTISPELLIICFAGVSARRHEVGHNPGCVDHRVEFSSGGFRPADNLPAVVQRRPFGNIAAQRAEIDHGSVAMQDAVQSRRLASLSNDEPATSPEALMLISGPVAPFPRLPISVMTPLRSVNAWCSTGLDPAGPAESSRAIVPALIPYAVLDVP